MRTMRLLTAAGIVSINACAFGGTGAALPVANRPGGATALLETSSGPLAGELIAVQDDGVVVAEKTIVFAPFTALKKFRINAMTDEYALQPLEIPDADKLARLRSVSHFPQGLTPAITKRLLEQAAQSDIVVIR